MAWPLEARRSLYPDWAWLCDESSPHIMALHIPVQILVGKLQMEFLQLVLHKHSLLEFSCQNLNRNVLIRNRHIFLGSRSERGGARRAPT